MLGSFIFNPIGLVGFRDSKKAGAVPADYVAERGGVGSNVHFSTSRRKMSRDGFQEQSRQ